MRRRWRWWEMAAAAFLAWGLTIPMCQRMGLERWNARRSEWSFAPAGVRQVEVHAWQAEEARVVRGGEAVQVSALRRLMPVGQHKPEPTAKPERSPQEWEFGWVEARVGEALVLKSRGEGGFPGHRYVLDAVEVRVPEGMEVKLVRQGLGRE